MTTRAVHTRRVFRFDFVVSRYEFIPFFMMKWRTMTELERMADRVWEKFGRKGARRPEIRFRRMEWAGLCTGRALIEINPDWSDYQVLFHELTHATGLDHGDRFMERYLAICQDFGHCCPARVLLLASLYGVGK